MPAASPLIVYYVTDHGYGHATRAAAVAGALERRGAQLALRTGVPAWIFADEGLRAGVTPVDFDMGLTMKDALSVDIAASLSAHEELLGRWERLVLAEAAEIRSLGARLVLSDAGALPLEAAKRAGVPAVLAANFGWDWIMEPWAELDPRWEAVRRRHAEAYAAADLFLRLPLGGDAPSCRTRADVPLVTRRTRFSRSEVRRILGVKDDERRPLIAFSFGGVPWSPPEAFTADGLEAVLFVAYAPRPRGVRADWIQLPTHAPLRHCDIVAAVDGLLTKPGYGTFSEILAARTPALIVERTDFRECGPLVENLKKTGRARVLPREEFEGGRWARPLAGLLAAGDPWMPVDLTGDEAVAERVLALACGVSLSELKEMGSSHFLQFRKTDTG